MMTLTPIHKPAIQWRAKPGAFGHGAMIPVRVVLHDTESHDLGGTTDIQAVAGFWMKTPKDSRLGAHFIVDEDGNIGQCGNPNELLYHTGGLNTGSVGIEQIGFARFTEKDWLDRADQLDKVAKLLAWLHDEYRIPLSVPKVQGQGDPMPGVLTHAMVSRFEPDSGGHSDPGTGYPLAHVLGTAQAYVKAGGWPAGGAPPAAPAKRRAKTQVTFLNRRNLKRTKTTRSLSFFFATHRHAKRHAGSWKPVKDDGS